MLRVQAQMKIVDPDKVSLCPDCGNPIKCDEPIACLNQFHEREPEMIVRNPGLLNALGDAQRILGMSFGF